jgi:glucose/arabinose dehydrogenase
MSLVIVGLLITSSMASASAAPAPDVAPSVTFGVHKIVDGLEQPVFLTNNGQRATPRLFVVERPGRIRILSKVGGRWSVTGTFLDMHARVGSGFQEQGLLGLAFAPDYAQSGRFYVDYTNTSGNTVIAEYHRADATHADPTSWRRVLTVGQPYENHNGGWIGFKGSDLYIALGDGGSAGDPGNRAQSLDTLLGKILRIDPRDPDGSGPKRYSIPSTNPFVGRSGLDEIWAYGLRNPWRDSFDPSTGDLWIGDVGQNSFEEVDHAGTARGRNFGWHLLEGRHLYPSGALCTANCKTLPVVEYRHSVAGTPNCSVIGGYVSRRATAALYGRYLFGDYCSGRIWAIPASFHGGPLPAPLNSGLTLSSFGVGPSGRIYAVALNGAIYRIDGT